MCELLIARGAPVNGFQTETGFTPLHLAVNHDNVTLVSCLARAFGDVNALDAQGNTPLLLAAAVGNAEICSVLVQAQSPLEVANADGITALQIAATKRHHAVVVLLAEALGRLRQPNTASIQAALAAAAANDDHISFVALLPLLSMSGRVAIIYAAEHDAYGTVHALTQQFCDSDPAAVSAALCSACAAGRVRVVRAMLEGGANRTARRMASRIKTAALQNDVGSFMLTDHGADASATDPETGDVTALMIACERGQVPLTCSPI